MGAILAILGTRIVTAIVGVFASYKLLAFFAVVTLGSLVIYNVFTEILQTLLAFVTDHINAQVGSQSFLPIEFMGVGAWMADCLRLPEQISVMVTFIGIKWLLMKVFFKW